MSVLLHRRLCNVNFFFHAVYYISTFIKRVNLPQFTYNQPCHRRRGSDPSDRRLRRGNGSCARPTGRMIGMRSRHSVVSSVNDIYLYLRCALSNTLAESAGGGGGAKEGRTCRLSKVSEENYLKYDVRPKC